MWGKTMMMRGRTALTILLILLFAGCGDDGPETIAGPGELYSDKGPIQDFDPDGDRLKVFHDRETFEAATGTLNRIGFEGLPGLGSSCGDPGAESLANPLLDGGVVFFDPVCLKSFLCPAPLCDSTNVVLHMGWKGTISFPHGTGGAILILEGMGAASFTLLVIDGNGGRFGVQAQAVHEEQTAIGFTAPSGIARIKILGTSSGGPAVLGGLAYEAPDGPSAGPRRIDGRIEL